MTVLLSIYVDDPAEILEDFHVITVKRGAAEAGPFVETTAPAATKASLTSPNSAPFLLAAKGMMFDVSGVQYSVNFTGGGALTAADTVQQINNAVGFAVASISGSQIKFSSTQEGSGASVKMTSGSALSVLGFVAGDLDIGEDPYVPLVSGTTAYQYTDLAGDGDTWYLVAYRNTTTGFTSQYSAPFKGNAVLVAASDLVVGTIDLADVAGAPVADVEVTFYPLDELAQAGTYWVGGSRAPVSITTDAAGHAEVSLVKGAVVKVAVSGTALVRAITVPSTGPFAILGLMASAPDPFTAAVPRYPQAPRLS